MNSVMRIATVFAAGAAAMYYLDPQTGRRRRALVREKTVAAGSQAKDLARAKSRQALDHARGAAARTRARNANAFVDDDMLRDQVRSRLGHLVDQPVDVAVVDGRVVLSANLSNAAFDELIGAVSTMPGVLHVESRMMTTASSNDTTANQDARH
ncbi:MAG: putative lipoprotein [Xanthomonadaceae bacterium]|nr:putative lipoprotein [Xanthomonadaceae bacterium]